MQTARWAKQPGLRVPPVREIVQLSNQPNLLRVPHHQQDQRCWQCVKYRVCVAAIVWDERNHRLILEASDRPQGERPSAPGF
jgi:hypothetical protein